MSLELEIHIRDVVGTAHVSANVATWRLNDILLEDWTPVRSQLDIIKQELCKALSDVMLVEHMLAHDWTDATYIRKWKKDSE